MYFDDRNIIYFLIYIGMYIVLFLSGYFIDRSRRLKWYMWIIPIFAYALNVGLRFGRGTDYYLYLEDFDRFADGSYPGEEPFFYFLCHFIRDGLGYSWPSAVFIMSFIMMTSGCVLLSSHKGIISYALPLFAYYSSFSEQLSRWFLAFSFVIIGIMFFQKELEKHNLCIALLLFFCGILFHYGIIIVVLILIIIRKFDTPLLSPPIAVVLMLFTYTFLDSTIFSGYLDKFSFLSINGRFDNYFVDKTRFIKEFENYGLSITDLIIFIIFIYKGATLVNKCKSLVYFYNIALIGVVLSPFMLKYELLLRINYCLTFFMFLLLAYAFYFDFKKFRFSSFFSLLVALMLLKNIVFSSFSIPGYKLLYIWDVTINAL